MTLKVENIHKRNGEKCYAKYQRESIRSKKIDTLVSGVVKNI